MQLVLVGRRCGLGTRPGNRTGTGLSWPSGPLGSRHPRVTQKDPDLPSHVVTPTLQVSPLGSTLS